VGQVHANLVTRCIVMVSLDIDLDDPAVWQKQASCRIGIVKTVSASRPRCFRQQTDLLVMTNRVGTLCGIWANSKSFLLAPGSRADRVGQQATQRTVSTGMSGRILISSEELL
jgi:hypothetical protein